MDARRTPERVLPTDAPNKTSGIGRQGRATGPPPRLPAPEQAKANPIPTQQGLWLEDDRRIEQGRKQAAEADEDQTVSCLQAGVGLALTALG
jgi:hypothetical protein